MKIRHCLGIGVLLLACPAVADYFPEELSGIVFQPAYQRDGDEIPARLLVVGNEANNSYFTIDTSLVPDPGEFTKLKSDHGEEHKLDTKEADDLESIEIIDGEVVVLSEAFNQVFNSDGMLIDYQHIDGLEPNGGWGLEGMSVRKAGDDFEIVVVHERNGLNLLDDDAPTFLIRKFSSTQTAVHNNDLDKQVKKLQPPKGYEGVKLICPDILWAWTEEHKCILLAMLEDVDNDEDKILQAYTPAGVPIGDSELLGGEDLDERRKLNWEGLCWYTDEDGNSDLLIVNDQDKDKNSHYIYRFHAPEGVYPAPPED